MNDNHYLVIQIYHLYKTTIALLTNEVDMWVKRQDKAKTLVVSKLYPKKRKKKREKETKGKKRKEIIFEKNP